jgi:SAM-dependent methyltransferase
MALEGKARYYADAWHGHQTYDARELIRLEKAARIVASLAFPPDRRCDLLDIGCGVGPLRQYLPVEKFRIVGTDISPPAAEQARQHYDDCLVGDVEESWPLPPASFDAVHAGAVLEHVLDWHAPLNGANRVLRDGGLLVLTVPNLRYWKEVRRLLRGKQPHWLTSMKHLHGYTPRFLQSLVELHGFAIEGMEADRVNLPLLPDSRWLCRHLAGVGSVLILWARVSRRVRVENDGRAGEFPGCKPVSMRSIEVPLG